MPIIALEYHDVIDGDDWNSSGFPGNSAATYKMAATRFDKHLDAVATVPNDTGRDVRLIGRPAGSDRPVLFTFDDGGASALCVIADRLERHGWRGHFLMTTGRIGAPGFLSAGELQELHRRGHVIGSHTESHPARMALLPPEDQAREWRHSRQTLEDVLGSPVEVASVPGGYFDATVAQIAAHAGIRWLFTSEPVSAVDVVDGCMVIGRFTLRQTSTAGVARSLVGAAPVARSSQWLKWNAKKMAKRLAGDGYLRLRTAIFRDDDQ